MIWTVGYAPMYDEMLACPLPKSYKIGKCDWLPGFGKYPGGCAFRTKFDAMAAIIQYNLQQYKPYALKGSWAKDVYEPQVGNFHILRNLQIEPT